MLTDSQVQRGLCPSAVPSSPSVFSLHCNYPSVTDLRFRGDAWILDAQDNMLTLWLGNYFLARLAGTSFDLPHLNTLLSRVRLEKRCRRL
jgi:hypothetical protein